MLNIKAKVLLDQIYKHSVSTNVLFSRYAGCISIPDPFTTGIPRAASPKYKYVLRVVSPKYKYIPRAASPKYKYVPMAASPKYKNIPRYLDTKL